MTLRIALAAPFLLAPALFVGASAVAAVGPAGVVPAAAVPAAVGTAAPAPAEEAVVDAPEETAAPAAVETTPPFVWMGYVDVGFADVEGDGSSFRRSDPRLPVDYGVDPFQPAINTRGDVANASPGGEFANGFLPRSMNIGGHPSFFINTVALDAKYQAPTAPVMIFSRLHILPRFGGAKGNETTLYLEQAFGRITPFSGRELFVSVGKFDSVFGIEYLDTQSNYRTGITPSLMARYTTGTSVGVKAFYRYQLAPLWSAVSLNAAATNSGNWIEALQPPDASVSGVPVASARLGYELNLPSLQLKLGGSGLLGPRNDQQARKSQQRMWGVDARLYFYGLSLAAEYDHIDEDEGSEPKFTGMGQFPLASEFHARGFWTQAAYGYRIDLGPWRAVTLYGRYEQRHAWFKGFRPLTVDRVTAGLRLDFWDCFILKGEVLFNGERKGAPVVDNDVLTFSAVYSW